MHRLNDLVDFWLTWLIHSGWQAAVVVGAAAMLLLLARRRSAHFRYALLLIVLAKFAAPPFLSLPVGLFSQARSPIVAEFPIAAAARDVVSNNHESTVELPSDRQTNGSALKNPPRTTSTGSAAVHAANLRVANAVPIAKIHWLTLGFLLIHAMGMLVAGLFVRRQYQQIQKLVRNSTLAADEIVELTRKTAAQLGLKSVSTVMVSDESDAPFATGLMKQIVLLPRSILELPTDQLQIILGHELVHIRRRDLTIGWLETVLSIVWWFHPGMWWLRRELRRTREDCCDDVLLTSHLALPERYCETLVEAAVRQAFLPPEPIALGFSNCEHPAARRIRRLMDGSLFRTHRLRKTALLLALAIGCLVLPGTQPLRGPVTKTSLEGMFGYRNLPFDPAEDELAIVKECLQVVDQFRSSYGNNGRMVRHFDDPETRDDLESILKRKPDFFYAQHLLGTWYRRNGDLAKGQQLLSAALKNAPIVLTQRYRTGSGNPLINVSIETMAIECNRVKNNSLNPELKLEFVDLVTDGHGEIALPVYDTVYRLYSRSYPEGYDTEMPNLGWFSSKSRIGVLPEVTTWKMYSRPNDFTRTAAESTWLSNAKGTTRGEILSGSNRFQIGRVARCQADGHFTERLTPNSSELRELPGVTNAGYMDHAIIDLTSPSPDRFDVQSIRVLDFKTKIPLTSFQRAAGAKVIDQIRFHLYSLKDKLPAEIDLVMTVKNHSADSFQMIIPAEAKGVYRKGGVTFVTEYLGAGQHDGWSSRDGFYKEAKRLDYASELLYKIDAPNGERFSLLLVTKDGQRIHLDSFSPVVRIPRPLVEIDHFEVAASVPSETIYFEKIALPPRTDPIEVELPTAEFHLTGVPETVSSDLFSPIILRCKTREGHAYSGGSFSGLEGYGFDEREADKRDPESKSTVVIEALTSSAIKLSPPYVSLSDGTELQRIGSQGISGPWGLANSSHFLAPLSELKVVKVRVIVESDNK